MIFHSLNHNCCIPSWCCCMNQLHFLRWRIFFKACTLLFVMVKPGAQRHLLWTPVSSYRIPVSVVVGPWKLTSTMSFAAESGGIVMASGELVAGTPAAATAAVWWWYWNSADDEFGAPPPPPEWGVSSTCWTWTQLVFAFFSLGARQHVSEGTTTISIFFLSPQLLAHDTHPHHSHHLRLSVLSVPPPSPTTVCKQNFLLQKQTWGRCRNPDFGRFYLHSLWVSTTITLYPRDHPPNSNNKTPQLQQQQQTCKTTILSKHTKLGVKLLWVKRS